MAQEMSQKGVPFLDYASVKAFLIHPDSDLGGLNLRVETISLIERDGNNFLPDQTVLTSGKNPLQQKLSRNRDPFGTTKQRSLHDGFTELSSD